MVDSVSLGDQWQTWPKLFEHVVRPQSFAEQNSLASPRVPTPSARVLPRQNSCRAGKTLAELRVVPSSEFRPRAPRCPASTRSSL
eukprot:4663995-Prymnesium_polylepis.1